MTPASQHGNAPIATDLSLLVLRRKANVKGGSGTMQYRYLQSSDPAASIAVRVGISALEWRPQMLLESSTPTAYVAIFVGNNETIETEIRYYIAQQDATGFDKVHGIRRKDCWISFRV